MRYAEYRQLCDEDKKKLHWRKHPRVRIATIFTVLFAVALTLGLLRILQNRRIHVNRKPNKLEAFTIAKAFVKDKLKQSATASFPKNNFDASVDTALNNYGITSFVNAQDSAGKIVKLSWQVNLAYTGGDWADKSSWKVKSLAIGK